MHGLGKAPGIVEVGGAGFTPQQIGVGRVGQGAIDSLIEAGADFEKSFSAAGRGSDEGAIALVDVGGEE